MKKVKKVVLVFLIILCFMIPFLWSCFELFALRPSAVKVTPPPNDSKWIGYFGIFMGPEYAFDEYNKIFVEKSSNKVLTIDDFYMTDEEFIEKYARSTDIVIKSLIKWRQHFDYEGNDKTMEYIPEKDKSLNRYVCSLGVKYLPHLFYYSRHTSTLTYGNQLRYSIDYILKRNTVGYVSYNSDIWNADLLKDIESIPYKVEEGNISDLGLLPLPYIINKLNNNDISDSDAQKYLDLLPDLAVYIYSDIFTDYDNKSREWWIKWASNFDKEISAINEFINLANKYC